MGVTSGQGSRNAGLAATNPCGLYRSVGDEACQKHRKRTPDHRVLPIAWKRTVRQTHEARGTLTLVEVLLVWVHWCIMRLLLQVYKYRLQPQAIATSVACETVARLSVVGIFRSP